MNTLLTQNNKMKRTSVITGLNTMDFALRAVLDCPFAGECRRYCYDKKSIRRFDSVKNKRNSNKRITKTDGFVIRMIKEIEQNNADVIRVHSGGDFYSEEYTAKWWEIARRLPNIKFYAYTKSLPFFKKTKIRYTNLYKNMPRNFTLIFSFGGTRDDLIDIARDRHAIVYTDKLPDGYSYANDNDHIALASNKKIALKKH